MLVDDYQPRLAKTMAALDAEYSGPFAFIRRHLNGDYSLARSYWLHTLPVSLLAPVVGMALLPLLGKNLPARYGSAGFLTLMTLCLVMWAWGVWGTWASSQKHVARGGSAGWAFAAKLIITLGIFRTVFDVVNLGPVFKEHLLVAAGKQFGPDATLELRVDRRSIQLSGGINDGSAERLEQALKAAPEVTTVVLTSNGGWILEGQLLAQVIRQHGLNTYVEGQCASACTIAFLAGKERAASPRANIGFHASRGVGSLGAATHEAETAELRALYRSAGLPESFVKQALDTPHETMWYPPHDELLAAGVLTRKSLGGETAAMSTSMKSRAAFAASLRTTAMFAALERRFPKDFEALIDAGWSKIAQGATDAEVVTAARSQLSSSLPRYLPLASDGTLVAYQALMQEQLEALRSRDAAACAEMAFPSGQPMNIIGNLPKPLAERELTLIAQVLDEADPARALTPGKKELARLGQQAFAGMRQDRIDLVVDPAARQRSSASQACNAAIDFVAGLNKIPVAERGRSLRVLYSVR